MVEGRVCGGSGLPRLYQRWPLTQSLTHGTPLDGGEEFLKPQLQEVPIVGRTVRDKGLEAGQKA